MYTLKIQFTRPSKGITIISKLIRIVMGTKYSHVLARWDGAKGRVDVVWEAAGSGIRFLGPIAHENKYNVVKQYNIELSKLEYHRLIEYTHKYAHVKYGCVQLIGMLIARIFRMNRNLLSSGEAAQVCSEAVGGLLRYVKGWDVNINLDVYGPDKLEYYLQNQHQLENQIR
jgi:hypothetical protein